MGTETGNLSHEVFLYESWGYISSDYMKPCTSENFEQFSLSSVFILIVTGKASGETS